MLGSAAVVASAFNLLCIGTMYTRDPNDPYNGPSTRDVTNTYRIDLVKKRWCVGDCTTTLPIVKIEATTIILQEITTPVDTVQAFSLTISRETGILFSTLRLSGIEIRTVQRCEVGPFGGFPPPKF